MILSFFQVLTGDYRQLIIKTEENQEFSSDKETHRDCHREEVMEKHMDISPVRFIRPYYNLLHYSRKKLFTTD